MDKDEPEFSIVHEVSVAELREALDRLLPDDILFPNQVGNLTIMRNGAYWGFINLLRGINSPDRIEAFDENEA